MTGYAYFAGCTMPVRNLNYDIYFSHNNIILFIIDHNSSKTTHVFDCYCSLRLRTYSRSHPTQKLQRP